MISVILPIHNAAKTLPAALESLLAQTWADFEILAVDDGSNDDHGTVPGTHAVLSEYAALDRRIRPLFFEHGGIVQALNRGLDCAAGELIARMDADDVCHPDRLRVQAEFLRLHSEVGLVACAADFGGNSNQAGGYKRHLDWTNTLLTHDQMSLGRFRESPLVHPTVMFRRRLVKQFGGYRDGPFPEDYELWLRWLECGVRMEKAPEMLYVWNDPPNRLSRTHPRYDVAAFYRTKARYLAQWLAAHNPGHPEIMVMGAGRITRRRAEMLLPHGVKITAWVDIDPRKVNRRVAERPVIHRNDIPPPGERFIVSYVAGHGAAEDITAFMTNRGYIQGRHFLLAA
ncbi:Glycosyltransferase involved in cell wall bisynthesis [Desulfonatronum thiosulfatophilum]|uniref:Glycosyltransferase involved in cell wall bisynthesis n=1 Tax=Desulfonatronum thiosulfatophilum TaxID=617002 RepID=A0A1G6CCI8_9BACT|nr:glycosyltransferase [Desulfonatronum thiosulfatophilum]SDB30605.1 Glycosyltransferase involved in cell wall bisynthesis [Desulfonatronum thiosulfatophilum]